MGVSLKKQRKLYCHDMLYVWDIHPDEDVTEPLRSAQTGQSRNNAGFYNTADCMAGSGGGAFHAVRSVLPVRLTA